MKFVEEGIEKGRRPELVGGGLIRSLGGWAEVKKGNVKDRDRRKGDERILGDSDFISQVISDANEKLDKKCRLKIQGYDIARVEKRIIEIFDIEKKDLYSGRRKQKISQARSVFCFWCVAELGESMTEMARRLDMSQPAVDYTVDRGENIVKGMGINLIRS